MTVVLDSRAVGDPARFLPFDELRARLETRPPAPRDVGRVVGLVTRVDGGRREILTRARVTVTGGMPGDAWGRKPDPKPEAQLAVMQVDVAELIANGQPLALFGDNLFLDLDLSAANLPPGTRLRAGGVTLEVTPKPHNGCGKFGARFGEDARRLVIDPGLRPRNLRGIYLRTVMDGELAVGQTIEVVRRG